MHSVVILALSGLGVFTLILGLLIWSYEHAQKEAAQERADYRECVRRIEASGKLNENSHGNGFEYKD